MSKSYNQRLHFSVPKPQVNFTIIGVFMYAFVVSALQTFLLRGSILWLIILLTSIGLIVLNKLVINKNGISLTVIDFIWMPFFIIFFLNISFSGLTNVKIIDLLIYSIGILFLLLVKVNIGYFESSLNLIKGLSILYACSAIFQYLNTNLYVTYILPLFPMEDQKNILHLMSQDSFTGLTNQTAYLAGYIINGIGIVLLQNLNKNNSNKFLTAFYLVLLFMGLLLAAKRAHLIFMIVALIFTLIVSMSHKVITKKHMKLIGRFIAVVIISFLTFLLVDFDDNSPIGAFKSELEATFVGILEGEDVSSGRTILYAYSWELFKESPIVGIGWREFFNDSKGVLNNDISSHPHNIYLQLLTELGIIGFILFIIPCLLIYCKTFRILNLVSIKKDPIHNWKTGIQYSFYSQTFFILYGLTGNVITDYSFLLMYFFACAISISAMVKYRKNYKIETLKNEVR